MTTKISEEKLKAWETEGDKNWEESCWCPQYQEVYVAAYLTAKSSSYEREMRKDIQIRDYLKSIELSCVSADDQIADEKIKGIEGLLGADSKDLRYEILDELEELQERIKLLEKPDRGVDIVRGYINKIESLESQLAIRDELLRQASEFLFIGCDKNCGCRKCKICADLKELEKQEVDV